MSDLQAENERLRAFALSCSERLADCSELLTFWAKSEQEREEIIKRAKDKINEWINGSGDGEHL